MSTSPVDVSTSAASPNRDRAMTARRFVTAVRMHGSEGVELPPSAAPTKSPRRVVSFLCAMFVVVAPSLAAAGNASEGPRSTNSTESVSPQTVVSSVAVDVTTFDAKVVSGVPVTPGEEVQGGGSSNEVIEYFAQDAIGSVRIVFDVAGNVVGGATYSPFGTETSGTAGMPPQHFTGQERDHEAQMDYFDARSYQARTGRFSTPDPILGSVRNPQSWNRYGYALNNPLMFTAPSGLQAQAECPDLVFDGVTYKNACFGAEIGGDNSGGTGGWGGMLMSLMEWFNPFGNWSTGASGGNEFGGYGGRSGGMSSGATGSSNGSVEAGNGEIESGNGGSASTSAGVAVTVTAGLTASFIPIVGAEGGVGFYHAYDNILSPFSRVEHGVWGSFGPAMGLPLGNAGLSVSTGLYAPNSLSGNSVNFTGGFLAYSFSASYSESRPYQPLSLTGISLGYGPGTSNFPYVTASRTTTATVVTVTCVMLSCQ